MAIEKEEKSEKMLRIYSYKIKNCINPDDLYSSKL